MAALAALSETAQTLASSGAAAQPSGDKPVIQQPDSAPVEQGSTASQEPQPSEANELIPGPVKRGTYSTAVQVGAEPVTPGDTAPGGIAAAGDRAGLQWAIARKNADNVVDSLVATDIVSFSDKNVGKALQRITGVQLTRHLGEGAQVSIRGGDPDLNRVEMNGATTPGQGGLGQRGADFRELASELIKSINVFEGYTAGMTQGGVGGTVGIQTRHPIELRDPLLAATDSMQYLDTLKTWQQRGYITAGTEFLGDRLGLILNVTCDRNDSRAALLYNTSWDPYARDANQTDLNNDKSFPDSDFANIATPMGCNAVPTTLPIGQNRAAYLLQFAELVPQVTRYGTWIRNGERISGIVMVQHKFTDNFDVYVEYQRNRRDNRLIDDKFAVDVERPILRMVETGLQCRESTTLRFGGIDSPVTGDGRPGAALESVRLVNLQTVRGGVSVRLNPAPDHRSTKEPSR